MRNRPNLFEVINRAPQQQTRRSLPGLSRWLRRADNDAKPPIVAEPLTEEQATAELAAQHAAAQEAARAREQALREKQARIEAKREAKEARKEARRLAKDAARAKRSDEADDLNIAAPIVRLLPGRLVLSLNTASCIVFAAGVCSLAIGAYSLGRRSDRNPGAELSKVAAINNGHSSTDELAALVPGLAEDGKAQSRPDRSSAMGDPDLSALLNKPQPASNSEARANRPAAVATGPSGPAAKAARLNYLQIESFPKSRNQSSRQLRADVEKVRRFLADRGIKTFARELPRSFVLLAGQGFKPSSDTRAKREAFQRKISRLGQDYRRAGGRYEFRGCFFVSYAKATAGHPA